MTNILVTGSKGQLGSEFKNIALIKPNINFYFKDKELDITKKSQLDNYFFKNDIDFIINTAAYTDVNNAEIEKEKADLVNEIGTKNIVELSKKYNCKLIHYSTDYVYDGKNKIPITENNPVNPLNHYGISKRNGEIFIEKSSCESVIIRTSWLYSTYGNNFVKTILEKIYRREKIFVVNDQFGCPTNAKDLAFDTLKIIDSGIKLDNHGKIYNYSNLGYTNWSNFAKKIIEFLNIEYEVHEVSACFFKSATVRPQYTITDKSKIKNAFNLKILNWEESLKTYLCNLKK